MATCKNPKCGKPIDWTLSANNKWRPFNPDGSFHRCMVVKTPKQMLLPFRKRKPSN